jgi:DinB superfamily
MAESAAQYIDRILSNVAGEDPWAVLSSTPTRLRELVEGKSDAAIGRRASPDRWSVREILAHLADAELVTSWRMRSILASNGAMLQAYDQNAFARVFNYGDAPVSGSLDLFETNRRANLRLLRSVDPALLENFGTHAERGRESIAHLIRLNAGHDLNHLKQIEPLLAGS